MENLIKALIKARAEFEGIKKDKLNPHFKKKYASLDSINTAVLPALCKNELVVTQVIESADTGQGIKTVLWHSSGEKIESFLMLPTINDMQKLGAAITYARRYSLSAILGISADEDDDGNSISGQGAKSARQPKPGCISEGQSKRMFAIASESGISAEQVKLICGKHGFKSRTEITKVKYDQIISEIQSFNKGEAA